MSNLCWFMDLTLQVPMKYCSLQHQTLLLPPNTSTTDSQKFSLWPNRFILSGAISNSLSFFPSSMLDIFWPGGSFSGVVSFCLFILHMGSPSKKMEWFGILSSSGPRFIRTSHWPIRLLWPCMACLIASLTYVTPFTIIRLWSMSMFKSLVNFKFITILFVCLATDL